MVERRGAVEIQDGRADDHYRPFQLIGIIAITLLGFAVFFLSFLLAPLAILVIFYVVFAASDRAKRNGNGHAHHDEPPEEYELITYEPEPHPATPGTHAAARLTNP